MKYIYILTLALTWSCNKQESPAITGTTADICLESSIDYGKIFYDQNRLMLRGGDSAQGSFDISNWSMGFCKLSNGVGRETFPALLDAQYISVSQESSVYKSTDRCIIMFTSGEPKVYPLELMRAHEVINERRMGEPVAVVYCVLADFPAVYYRTFCGKELTFAPSGYTFSSPQVDNDRRAFVLWDRDTESLWWPLIDVAVSGSMIGTDMQKLPKSDWKVIPWSEVLYDYPNAVVLKRNQTMPIPKNWPRIDRACP